MIPGAAKMVQTVALISKKLITGKRCPFWNPNDIFGAGIFTLGKNFKKLLL
jgi:hypothetical protein